MKRLQCNVKLSLFNKILRGNILLNPSKGPQWDLGGNLPRSNLVAVILRGSISEKAMALYSNTLAWKIPWMEEPGELQSMGSLRVGHN